MALALADEGNFAAVIGVDLDPAALELARENARRTGLSVRFLRSDFGAGLAGSRFDLIVSNPPYLTDAEYAALDGSVRDWEPRLALASGPDGLEASRRVLEAGTELLGPGGWLVMELDSTRGAAVAHLAREAGYREIGVWNDLFGRSRYLTALSKD